MFCTASDISTMEAATSDHQNTKSTPSGMPVFNLSTLFPFCGMTRQSCSGKGGSLC